MNENVSTNLHDRQPVNWRQVALFTGLSFGLAWAIDLVLALSGGYGAAETGAATLLLLQTQMLMPAFAAILLGLFVFKNSPFYFRREAGRGRVFLYFFLVFTAIFIALSALVVANPGNSAVIAAIASSFNILGVLVLIAIRAFSGREAFARVGLAGGRFRDWVLYGTAFVLFYLVQTALNAAFRLGTPADVAAIMEASGLPAGMSSEVFFLIAAVQTVALGPLLGLIISFGEEYGWRGYLQGELVKLGRKRGILLLGLIWAAWHYPIIIMGHNYPGEPVLGVILMTLYTTLLAFVLGWVMLRTGSIWLVAFLHAVNNQTYSFLSVMVYTPTSPVFSFGAGIYGALTLALVVLLILRDPIWEEDQTAQAWGVPQNLQVEPGQNL